MVKKTVRAQYAFNWYFVIQLPRKFPDTWDNGTGHPYFVQSAWWSAKSQGNGWRPSESLTIQFSIHVSRWPCASSKTIPKHSAIGGRSDIPVSVKPSYVSHRIAALTLSTDHTTRFKVIGP